jgi:hypothetical protein
MIDKYFKLEHAREEIQRLNIEIPRVITYIRDEEVFLQRKELELKETNPIMAHQVQIHRWERARFNKRHMHRFRRLASLPGFTGSIQPGIGIDVDSELHELEGTETYMDVGADHGEGEEEEEEDDQEDADIRDTIAALMFLTVDKYVVDVN